MYTLLETIRIRLDEYDVDADSDMVVFPPNKKLEVKLGALIEKAKRDIINYRHYPDSYTEEMIADDLESKYYNTVIDLVVYDYSKEGGEYESVHNENGVNRTFVKRESILGTVVPFCRVY